MSVHGEGRRAQRILPNLAPGSELCGKILLLHADVRAEMPPSHEKALDDQLHLRQEDILSIPLERRRRIKGQLCSARRSRREKERIGKCCVCTLRYTVKVMQRDRIALLPQEQFRRRAECRRSQLAHRLRECPDAPKYTPRLPLDAETLSVRAQALCMQDCRRILGQTLHQSAVEE